MKALLKILFALNLISFTFLSFANDEERIDSLFEILAYHDVNFTPTGTVCEQVALVEFEELYPKSKFNIIVGLEYGQTEAIGELDVVVFDKLSNQVHTVAEVKCWKNPTGGLKKAKAQRQRFQTNVTRNIRIWDKNKKTYSPAQFTNVREYLSVGQKGVLENGYDIELSLDLKDMMKLRNKLLDCYAHKKCPRLN